MAINSPFRFCPGSKPRNRRRFSSIFSSSEESDEAAAEAVPKGMVFYLVGENYEECKPDTTLVPENRVFGNKTDLCTVYRSLVLARNWHWIESLAVDAGPVAR